MRRVLSAAIALAVPLLLAVAAPTAAFPLTTCTLSLASTDGSGASLDTAQGGAPDGTQADPFEVDWDGQVGYTGSTTAVIKDYTYGIAVFGIPTPLQGGGDNSAENTDGDGSVSVAANSPFRAAGLYFVSGEYTGAGGACKGSGWFLLKGDPIGTVPWLAGVGLTILGALGLVAGARGHTLTSIVGGALLGVGLDLLLISHAVLPLAENTPLAVIIITTVVGLIIGIAGRRGRGGGAEAASSDVPPSPPPVPPSAPDPGPPAAA
jgi:hypothetical protein